MKIFKTKKGSSEDVVIDGVGFLGADSKGGVPVERAAQTMSELQKRDKDGVLELDEDGNAQPLSGSALAAAAKKYADSSPHAIEIVEVAEDKLPTLAVELGSTPGRPPAAEVAVAAYEDSYAGAERVNASVEVVASNEAAPRPEGSESLA